MSKNNEIIEKCTAEYFLAGVSQELKEWITDNLPETDPSSAILGSVYEYCTKDFEGREIPESLQEEVEKLKKEMEGQYTRYFYINEP